ncbi:hypothetical protein HAP47_0030800 [Bradyrhizobium sp. 41S5]|uniref:hypothetical protein n=1 Tax=Bradyrhizobium sp. 41S5 TaxID=1404443 RepID=UPI00156BC2CB|nr:hypothetical protein [Bradyrhizobium sp. 41S5]UFX43577.1 hypothetical protein HAP47_0030800 [Bradyrhizobium sp. 41S5]
MVRRRENELWSWSAVDLARAIATRAISSRDAVQSSLDRIAEVNPALNAEVIEARASTLTPIDPRD